MVDSSYISRYVPKRLTLYTIIENWNENSPFFKIFGLYGAHNQDQNLSLVLEGQTWQGDQILSVDSCYISRYVSKHLTTYILIENGKENSLFFQNFQFMWGSQSKSE